LASNEHAKDNLYSFSCTVCEIDVLCIAVSNIVSRVNELSYLVSNVLEALGVGGVGAYRGVYVSVGRCCLPMGVLRSFMYFLALSLASALIASVLTKAG
jgi:hypothetical protein